MNSHQYIFDNLSLLYIFHTYLSIYNIYFDYFLCNVQYLLIHMVNNL